MQKKSLLLLTTLSSVLFAEQSCPTPTLSQITFKHREKGGVGYDKGYTTAELFFLPAYDLPVYPFIDLRGHVFNDGQFAGNGGLGARYETPSFPIAFGANAYYDFRESESTFFSQVSFGVEALSDYLDLRMNGYIPFGKRDIASCPEFCGFLCNNAVIQQTQQTDLALFELEFGSNIPQIFAPADLYLALGPYYLFKRETSLGPFGDAWGVRFRLIAEVLDSLAFGLDVTYDHIFDTKVQGLVALTFPFTPAHTTKRSHRWRHFFSSDCDAYGEKLSRVSRPVYHNEIVPFQKKTIFSALRDPCTGCPYNFVFFYNHLNLPGSGTSDDPYYDLGQAHKLTAPGDILYVFPGDPVATFTGVTLQDNQSLISAAVPLCLGNVTIPALCENQPTLTNLGEPNLDGKVVIVTLANNNQVRGFQIVGNNSNVSLVGISGENFDSGSFALITENSFDGLNTGIQFIENAERFALDIKGNSFLAVSDKGIQLDFQGFSSSFQIFGNTFENLGGSIDSNIEIANLGFASQGVISFNEFLGANGADAPNAIQIMNALGGKFIINNNVINDMSTAPAMIPINFTTSLFASVSPCLQVLDNTFIDADASTLSGPITLEVPNPSQGSASLELINFGTFTVNNVEFIPLGSCSN